MIHSYLISNHNGVKIKIEKYNIGKFKINIVRIGHGLRYNSNGTVYIRESQHMNFFKKKTIALNLKHNLPRFGLKNSTPNYLLTSQIA